MTDDLQALSDAATPDAPCSFRGEWGQCRKWRDDPVHVRLDRRKEPGQHVWRNDRRAATPVVPAGGLRTDMEDAGEGVMAELVGVESSLAQAQERLRRAQETLGGGLNRAAVDRLAASPSPDTDREHYPRVDGPVGSVLCACGDYQYDGWTFPDQGLPPDFWQHTTRPSPATDAGLAKHVHDLLASVAFLRSVIASGETLNASDEARLREVYEAARLATPDKDQPDDHRHGALCANGWCDEDDGGLR